MLHSFLKRVLPGYALEKNGKITLLTRGAKDPIFCLLPFWISQKKIKELSVFQKSCPSLIYLKRSYNLFPPSKKLLQTLQPLYFMTLLKDKSFLFYDRRYLKTTSGYYLLPPVSIKLSTYFKGRILQSLEEELLFPTRKSTPFYLGGDTTHRLLQPSYLDRLQKRQTLEISSSFSIYRFFKKILDD